MPRLFTPPLVEGMPGPCVCGRCALTPESSYGFDVIRFADEVIRRPLYPWQRFVVVHAGELLPDGRPRFRKILILVARQNGKTQVLVVLTLFWLFVDAFPLVLGTSTKLDYARESWEKAVKVVEATPALDDLRPANRNRGVRRANGEQEIVTVDQARYKIAPADEEGGRSLTLDKAILDELRQHHDYGAWDAVIPAGNAVPHFQAFALSNAGSDRSVVLNDLREQCVRFLETGEGDERTGLFEWSAPDGSDPTDAAALLQANPLVGYRIDLDTLVGDAAAALAKGGDKLRGFLTESMCVRVPRDEPPIWPPESWAACRDPQARRAGPPAIAVDANPARTVATIGYCAADDDGRPLVQVVWRGSIGEAAEEVGRLVKAKDATCVVMDRMSPIHSKRREIEAAVDDRCDVWVTSSTELADACGAIYDAVCTEQLRHTGQPALDAAQAAATERIIEGGRRLWDRRDPTSDITGLMVATLSLAGLAKYPGDEQFAY